MCFQWSKLKEFPVYRLEPAKSHIFAPKFSALQLCPLHPLSCVKIQHLKSHTMLPIPVPLFTSLHWELTALQFTSVSFHCEIRIETRLTLCDCCEEQISWYENALTQCLVPGENHTVLKSTLDIPNSQCLLHSFLFLFVGYSADYLVYR